MLKIEERNQRKKSNQDVYDAVNQGKIKPAASSVDNPLDELDQFDMPSQEVPTPLKGGRNQSPEDMGVPEPPSYSGSDYNIPYSAPSFEQSLQQPQISSDYIQQIAEEVVGEKWDDLMNKVGDIRLWKDKIDTEITSIKQEIMRTQNHFENLQRAVLGKVGEYNENIVNINNEMKALEKVFEKIIQPLTNNIKELNRITDKLKNKKI